MLGRKEELVLIFAFLYSAPTGIHTYVKLRVCHRNHVSYSLYLQFIFTQASVYRAKCTREHIHCTHFSQSRTQMTDDSIFMVTSNPFVAMSSNFCSSTDLTPDKFRHHHRWALTILLCLYSEWNVFGLRQIGCYPEDGVHLSEFIFCLVQICSDGPTDSDLIVNFLHYNLISTLVIQQMVSLFLSWIL